MIPIKKMLNRIAISLLTKPLANSPIMAFDDENAIVGTTNKSSNIILQATFPNLLVAKGNCRDYKEWQIKPKTLIKKSNEIQTITTFR